MVVHLVCHRRNLQICHTLDHQNGGKYHLLVDNLCLALLPLLIKVEIFNYSWSIEIDTLIEVKK